MSDEVIPNSDLHFNDNEKNIPNYSSDLKPSPALNSAGEVRKNVPFSSVFFLSEMDYRDLKEWGSSVEPDQRSSSFWWTGTIVSIILALFFLSQLSASGNQDAPYFLVPIAGVFALIAIFCQFKLWQNVRMSKMGRTIQGELINFSKAKINLPRGSYPIFSVEYKFVNPVGEVIYATGTFQPLWDRYDRQKPDVKSGTPVAVLYNDDKHYKML